MERVSLKMKNDEFFSLLNDWVREWLRSGINQDDAFLYFIFKQDPNLLIFQTI